VNVNLSTGAGMDIVWKDGHHSHFSFPFLRDACPCATCDDERGKSGRAIGAAPQPKPGELPMFRPSPRPTDAQAIGRYAIGFNWNDGHDTGIYSWDFLRAHCPCDACKAEREKEAQPA
jgi:DUF971 family protein